MLTYKELTHHRHRKFHKFKTSQVQKLPWALKERGMLCAGRGRDYSWTWLLDHLNEWLYKQSRYSCVQFDNKTSKQEKEPLEIFLSRKAANSSTEALRRKTANVHSCTFHISAHTLCCGRNKAGEGKQWSCCPACPAQLHQALQLVNTQLLLTVYLRPPCKEELGHLLAARLTQLGSCTQLKMKKKPQYSKRKVTEKQELERKPDTEVFQEEWWE